MPFIGQEPLVGGYHVLDNITTSATNTYNLLLNGVAFGAGSPNHLLVSLNGVIQKPGSSFSVSGTQITFIPSSGTLSSSDSIDFILSLGNVLNVGVPSDSSIINTPTLSGNTTINSGNLIVGTAGKGIDFSAATDIGSGETVGSSILDDYEEGSFQPSITADATMSTISYTHRFGYYTKIGNKVFFDMYLNYGSSNSQGVQVYLSGLPFTSSNANSGRYAAACTIGSWSKNGIKDVHIVPQAWLNPNTTRINIAWMKTDEADGMVEFTDSNLAGSAGEIFISGSYSVS